MMSECSYSWGGVKVFCSSVLIVCQHLLCNALWLTIFVLLCHPNVLVT